MSNFKPNIQDSEKCFNRDSFQYSLCINYFCGIELENIDTDKLVFGWSQYMYALCNKVELR